MKICMMTKWERPCGIADYSGHLKAALERQGVPVIIAPVDRPPRGTAIESLICQAGGCDVVHIQHEFSFFGDSFFQSVSACRKLLAGITVPTVMTVHELALARPGGALRALREKILFAFQKEMFNRSGALIVHSRRVKDLLVAAGVPEGKVTVMMHPVPAVPVPAVAETVKAGELTVTVFGFVVERKGYEIVFLLAKKAPHCRFIIAGGAHPSDRSGYCQRLEQRIKDEGMEGRIMITGYVPEERVPEIMAQTDIILAPFTDIFASGSVSLAAAYRKPVLASDIPYFRELRDNGFGVELFATQDPDDAAVKLGAVTRTRDSLRDLGKLNDAYAAKNSYDAAAVQHSRLYAGLAGRR